MCATLLIQHPEYCLLFDALHFLFNLQYCIVFSVLCATPSTHLMVFCLFYALHFLKDNKIVSGFSQEHRYIYFSLNFDPTLQSIDRQWAIFANLRCLQCT